MDVHVETDYDGYFERLVRSWIARVAHPKHRRVLISAGPWRPYAVKYTSSGSTLHLDFYAALRSGFGELSKQDVADILQVL